MTTRSFITAGDRIAFLLKQKNLNYMQAGKKTGLSPGTISRACKGCKMTAETVRFLAAHLGTTADWILDGGEDDRKRTLCSKQKCGLHAVWHVDEPSNGGTLRDPKVSCDECLSYFMSRDYATQVRPYRGN